MKYLEMKKRAFMSIVNRVKGFIRTISGASLLILPYCVDEDSLINYTISGDSIQSMLPKGYQSVEYIESSGTQYIDTEVIANQDTGFEIKFLAKNNIADTDYGSIFGARTGSSNAEYHLTTYTSSGTLSYRGTFRFNNKSFDGGIPTDEKEKISLKNGIYTTSDNTEIVLSEESFTTPCSLTLFALNQKGTPTQYGSLQLFSFKLYDGDILLRDFIPCCRLVDNVVGLYDLVNDKFYSNKGTGSFLKGSDVSANPTPEAPIEVESVGDKTVNLFDKSLSPAAGIPDETAFTGYGSLIYSNQNVLETLKPDTTYTITYKVEMVSTPSDIPSQANYNPIGLALYSGVSGYTNLNFYKVSGYDFTPGSVYEFKQTFTTPSNLTDSSANYRMIGYSGRYLMDDSTTKPGTVILSKIQIEEGDTTISYEPYGYKIPVKASGVNIYNPAKTSYTANGVTFTKNPDNTFTVNGTATANVYFHMGDLPVDLNKTYYISGGTSNVRFSVRQMIDGVSQNSIISTGEPVALPTTVYGKDLDTFNPIIHVNAGVTCENEIVKPMITHKYWVSNKNYFELDKYTKLIENSGADRTSFISIQNGIIKNQYDIYYAGAYFLTEEPFELAAGTYMLGGNVNKWRKTAISVGLRFEDGTNSRENKSIGYCTSGWREFSTKITLTEPMTVIGVYLQDNGASEGDYKSPVEFKDIYIENADNIIDYEPYVEPITTNVYLNEPLRKILDYADYIDFENQKLIRNIGNTLLSASALSGSSENTEMLGLYGRISDRKSIDDMYSVQVLSPNLLGVARYGYGVDIPCMAAHVTGTVVYFKLPKALLDAETAAAANRYLNANPTTVFYIKDTPTETDIVLPKLPTLKGTTVYSVEAKTNPSNITATYYSSMKGE